MAQTVADQSVPSPNGDHVQAVPSPKRWPLQTVPLTADQRDLVESAIPLARWVAKRAARNVRADHLPDLIQTAMVALCRAAKRFDPARGVSFGTYAAPACRRAVRDEMNEHLGVIDLPRWLFRKDGAGHGYQVFAAQARRLGSFRATTEPLSPQAIADDRLDAETLLAWLSLEDRVITHAWLGGETFKSIATWAGIDRFEVAASVRRILSELRDRAGR